MACCFRVEVLPRTTPEVDKWDSLTSLRWIFTGFIERRRRFCVQTQRSKRYEIDCVDLSGFSFSAQGIENVAGGIRMFFLSRRKFAVRPGRRQHGRVPCQKHAPAGKSFYPANDSSTARSGAKSRRPSAAWTTGFPGITRSGFLRLAFRCEEKFSGETSRTESATGSKESLRLAATVHNPHRKSEKRAHRNVSRDSAR